MKDKLLDRFLFEVKRDAEKSIRRSLPTTPPLPEVSIYANPDNWYTTRIVELVCRDLEGSDESLGFFREERHRISLSARRLRPTEDLGQSICGLPGAFLPGVPTEASKEIVTGAHWISPRQESKVIDSAQEIETLKKLFLELIGEA